MNRRLLTFLTLGGLSALYHVTLARGHFARIDACHGELEACYAEFERATGEAARTTALRQEVDDLERLDDELRERMVFDPVAQPALLDITKALRAAGLDVQQAETLADNARWQMPHQRVRAIVAGRFGQLFDAVRSLENASPPTRVTELSVRAAADGGTVRGELVVVRSGGAP